MKRAMKISEKERRESLQRQLAGWAMSPHVAAEREASQRVAAQQAARDRTTQRAAAAELQRERARLAELEQRIEADKRQRQIAAQQAQQQAQLQAVMAHRTKLIDSLDEIINRSQSRLRLSSLPSGYEPWPDKV